MPLIKSGSKKAFGKNVSTEMKAGKPQSQSLAIAYNVQKKNKKKMALGGAVESSPSTKVSDKEDKMNAEHEHSNECWVDGRCMYAEGGEISAKGEKRPMPDNEYNDSAEANRQKKSMKPTSSWIDPESSHEASGSMSRAPHEGAKVNWQNDEEETLDNHFDSIADAIIAKKRRKMMAEGGEVDLEENSEESPNFEDQQSFKANGKEQYDDSQLSDQPEDSNEHGDEMDSDIHDMVSRIRAKLKAKRGM